MNEGPQISIIMSHFLKDLTAVSFFGRPYRELLNCFGLEESELIGTRVLELPSGPSSFVAEGTRRGIDVTGVDPLFYRSPEALRRLAVSDFESMFERVRAKSDRFARKTYASIEEAETVRREALELFLEDYAKGFAVGRYRVGELPSLDFEDASFDRVLCAHFLFIYSDLFDEAFHLKAVEELCRLARNEVRIHPLVDATGEVYPGLELLRRRAGELGFSSRIQNVDHEFFKGTTQTLVLERMPVDG